MSQEILNNSNDLLSAGNASDAFQALRELVQYPNVIESEHWQPSMTLLSRISDEFGVPALSQTLSDLAGDPDNVQLLYDAAYAFYEQGVNDVAAMLLQRANELAPNIPGIVSELVGNLEELMYNDHAITVLQQTSVTTDDAFLNYLLAFNAMMCGDLALARQTLARLDGIQVDEQLVPIIGNIHSMLARADALTSVTKLDDLDLSGWHMVLNAGVLLHESPYGYEDGMAGRYAYVQDSYALVNEGIQRLSQLLQASTISPQRVVAADDRSSQIVAAAAAKMLQLPCEVWSPGDTRPGLVMAYDMAQTSEDFYSQMVEHHPDQILWAHVGCWTSPTFYTPDVITFLYQSNVGPWEEGRLRVDPETRETTQLPADESSIEDLAKEIIDAAGEHESHTSMQQVIAIVNAVRSLPQSSCAGLFKSGGQRTLQRRGSKVKSSLFF